MKKWQTSASKAESDSKGTVHDRLCIMKTWIGSSPCWLFCFSTSVVFIDEVSLSIRLSFNYPQIIDCTLVKSDMIACKRAIKSGWVVVPRSCVQHQWIFRMRHLYVLQLYATMYEVGMANIRCLRARSILSKRHSRRTYGKTLQIICMSIGNKLQTIVKPICTFATPVPIYWWHYFHHGDYRHPVDHQLRLDSRFATRAWRLVVSKSLDHIGVADWLFAWKGNMAGKVHLSGRKITRRTWLRTTLATDVAWRWGEKATMAAGKGERVKWRGISPKEVRDILEKDIGKGQYFVTGNLTQEIFEDDCRFVDPTNDVTGLKRYLSALNILFDPSKSSVSLLGIQLVDGKTIVADYEAQGVLQLPWRPVVKPYRGHIVYNLNKDGLVQKQEQTWDISALDALLETFMPGRSMESNSWPPNLCGDFFFSHCWKFHSWRPASLYHAYSKYGSQSLQCNDSSQLISELISCFQH